MKIDFTEFTKSLSVALDYAEKELLDINPYHGLRVAFMTDRMAEYFNMDENMRYALIQTSILHDCALSEYMNDETGNYIRIEENMGAHCSAGEEILEKFPNHHIVKGSVKYHHERADGKGAFGLKEEETPLYAQLIHTADAVDMNFDLYNFCDETYSRILSWMDEKEGKLISSKCKNAFINSISMRDLSSICGEKIHEKGKDLLKKTYIDVSVDALADVASVFADITDYKSHFTWRHSMGIANKAEKMGIYYNLPHEKCKELYIAGALHDIGKLVISNEILEKPGRLSKEEYTKIQNHALGTWDLLKNITGMEDIAKWACLHHERLDGSGYPFGYKDDDLDKNSRLLACLDVYQALIEERPYKRGMSHSSALEILEKMGNDGQLDKDIISDINDCFKNEEAAFEEKPSNEIKSVKVSGLSYICSVCGYIYEGEIHPDFICPRCKSPASGFEKAK